MLDKKKYLIYGAFLLLIVLGVVFISSGSSGNYITGFASKSSESINKDSLIKATLNSLNKEDMKKVFEAKGEITSKIIKEATKQGVDPNLMLALMYHESRFDVNALRCENSYEKGRSGPYQVNVEKFSCAKYDCDKLVKYLKCYSGCNEKQISRYGEFHQVSCSYGLGQLMYPTACGLGFKGSGDELMNPDKNIELSVKLIKILLEKYNHDTAYALADYNAGITAVRRCRSDSFESFYKCLPAVTRKYIPNIMASSFIFEDLSKGVSFRDESYYTEEISSTFKTEFPSVDKVTSSSVSVKPNFKHLLSYSFTEYEILKKDASDLLDSCTDVLGLESCIKSKLNEYNRREINDRFRFQWEYEDQCISNEEEQSESLVKVIDYIDKCMRSETKNCYCTADFQVQSRSSIKQQYGNAEIQHIHDKKSTIEKYILLDITVSNPLLVDNTHKLGIDDEGNLFNADSSLPECIYPLKTSYRFCVESSETIALFEDGKFSLKPVYYRFALNFEDSLEDSSDYSEEVMTFYSDSKNIRLITKVGEAE